MTVTQQIETTDFKIVDFHAHLPVKQDDWIKPWRERYIAQNGEERYRQLMENGGRAPSWLPEFCFPEPYEAFDDADKAADAWAKECETNELERIVFATGGGNDMLAGVVAQNPGRFSGFAHHYIGDERAAETLEKAVAEQGLCGYKILAPVVEHPLADRRYEDVFEVCNEYALPVLVHFGILGGGSACGLVAGENLSPLALAETAQRFPRANFIVPHFGCGFTNELLMLCWASPNVYVDTSGNNLWTKWTMENYTLEQLFSRFYSTVGASRILFGTDSEWFPRGFAVRYLIDQLRAVRALNMPAEDIKLIFRENALKLLKL